MNKSVPALVLLTTTLVLGGCASPGGSGPDSGAVPPGAGDHAGHGGPVGPETPAAPASPGDHGGHEAHGSANVGHDLPATAGPGYTVADVQFMQMMIGHHAQALTMAEKAPTHEAGPAVRSLAHRIDISQRDEIRFMERWLEERGQAVPGDDHLHSMEMPGMVSPEQFARLDATRGPEFDRLFLSLMIDHHLGATQMVDELFSSPMAGQDSDIFRFATDVAADQFDEIAVMERILDRIAPSNGSDPR